jgi:hypothetical protein
VEVAENNMLYEGIILASVSLEVQLKNPSLHKLEPTEENNLHYK